MKWYEKTWEWIKKYWGVVLSAVTLAVGYIIGRKQLISRYHSKLGINVFILLCPHMHRENLGGL